MSRLSVAILARLEAERASQPDPLPKSRLSGETVLHHLRPQLVHDSLVQLARRLCIRWHKREVLRLATASTDCALARATNSGEVSMSSEDAANILAPATIPLCAIVLVGVRFTPLYVKGRWPRRPLFRMASLLFRRRLMGAGRVAAARGVRPQDRHPKHRVRRLLPARPR